MSNSLNEQIFVMISRNIKFLLCLCCLFYFIVVFFSRWFHSLSFDLFLGLNRKMTLNGIDWECRQLEQWTANSQFNKYMYIVCVSICSFVHSRMRKLMIIIFSYLYLLIDTFDKHLLTCWITLRFIIHNYKGNLPKQEETRRRKSVE